MKILIITPRIPYPPFRGDKLKIFNISKQLRKNNSVTILTFLRNNDQIQDIDELKKIGLDVKLVKFSFLNSLLNVLGNIFTSIPFQVAWYKSSAMAKKIQNLHENEGYDIIYFHLIRSAQYINHLGKDNKSSLLITDYTDAVSLYLDRFYKIEKNIFKKLFLFIEKKRVEKFEKIANNFHTLFICSEIDRDYLIKRGINTNIRILKNGIDTDYFKPEPVEYDPNRIIFTGNIPYYANSDAVIYFAKEIFPLILKKIPEARFFVVGQNPTRKIKKLASDRIVITGLKPDIKSEYLKSAVNIAPMRFGAGTLNKVIESIALGVPVVATSMAIGGLPDELKKYIFIADDNINFANKVIDIIKNPDIRKNLMKKRQVVIRDLLSWENIVMDFEKYLKSSVKEE